LEPAKGAAPNDGGPCNKLVVLGQGRVRTQGLNAPVRWGCGRLTPIGGTGQHFLDLDRNPIPAHDDHALSDWKIVSENLHLVVFRGVKLDNGAATKAQNLVNWHRGDAEHYGNVK